MNWIIYVSLGVVAGIVGGFLGLGGGIIMVPALIFILGLSQHEAQGTALAVMIPPIGLLAAMRYYVSGNVKINIALFMCLGFFVGGYFGASLAHHIPDSVLRRSFGVIMLYVSVRMILGK